MTTTKQQCNQQENEWKTENEERGCSKGTTLHYSTLHYTTLQYTILHYTTLQYTHHHAIPVHTIKRNHLMFPPNLHYLLKLKNYYRHRYQRSRLPSFHYLFQHFAQIFSPYRTRLRNSKWSPFLGSLHTRTTQLREVARYFTKSSSSLPPPPQFTRACKFTTPHTKQKS